MPDTASAPHHPAAPYLRHVSPLARSVLLALWTYGHPAAGACAVWPSARTVAELLGSNPARVRRAIRDLETIGALARCVGPVSCVATRQTFDRSRAFLLLIPARDFCAGVRFRSFSDRNRSPGGTVSIAKGSKPYPEQLRTVNLKNSPSLNCRRGDLAPEPDGDEDEILGVIFSALDRDAAIPWRETITPPQRRRLRELAEQHGAAELARGLLAVRRQMLARGLLRLTGPAMVEASAWASVWHHHGPALRSAMTPPPPPERAAPAPLEPLEVTKPETLAADVAALWKD